MALAVYEVPLTPEAQTFNIALAGVTYALTLRWNAQARAWALDIATAARAPLLQGLLVVTGLDLLAQYAHMGFGGRLVAQTDHDPTAVPTADNLGLGGRLYFVTGEPE